MPEPRRGRRRAAAIASALTTAMVLALTLGAIAAVPALAGVRVLAHGAGTGAPGVAPAHAVLLAPAPETCEPQETLVGGGFNVCGSGTGAGGGGGGPDLAAFLPIVGVVAVAGVVVLVAGFVLLRRTSAPLAPADPGEWWTCRTCGKTNVIGSARCYACGTWQR